MACLLVVIGGFFLFSIVLQIAGSHPPLHHQIVVDLVFVALATWTGSTYNRSVILHQDAIEVLGWFYSRKLFYAEIRSRQTTGPYAYILLPSDKGKRKLVLPVDLDTDQIFQDWIKTIPKVPR